MARVVKRGKRRYQIQIFLGRDEGGKQKFYTKQIEGTREQAERLASELQLKHDSGTRLVTPPAGRTLDDLLDAWLKLVVRVRVSNRTFSDYAQTLRLYVRPELGKRALTDLTASIIQEHYHYLLFDRKLSARTVRIANIVLNGALREAVRWQMIPANPAASLDLPRRSRGGRFQFLSPPQVLKFILAARDVEYGIVFIFAVVTGMRPEEYLALAWSDMDLTSPDPYVMVRRTLLRPRKVDGKSQPWEFGQPKTAASRRRISLPPSFAVELLDYRIEQERRRRHLEEYFNFDLVFATPLGQPLISDNLATRHFKPLLKAAGLPAIRLYDLRHSCATFMLANGENAKVVSERLGHTSVAFTLDTYAHVLPTMQQTATAQFEEHLFQRRLMP
jgi:integrase